MSLAVADWSGQAWLQGFNDVGLAVFGMPANDLIEIKVGTPFVPRGHEYLISCRRTMMPSTMLSSIRLIVRRSTLLVAPSKTSITCVFSSLGLL